MNQSTLCFTARALVTATSFACALVACGGHVDLGKEEDTMTPGTSADGGELFAEATPGPIYGGDDATAGGEGGIITADASVPWSDADPDPEGGVIYDAMPACNYELQVQPIFDRGCAIAGCHVLPSPASALDLAPGFSYSSLMTTPSSAPPMRLVEPGDPANSYLYRVVTGTAAPGTSPMPPKGGATLTVDEQAIIECWITSGAKP